MHVPYCQKNNLSHQVFLLFFIKCVNIRITFFVKNIPNFHRFWSGRLLTMYVCALRPVCSWEKNFFPIFSAISKKYPIFDSPLPPNLWTGEWGIKRMHVTGQFRKKIEKEGQKGLSPQGEKQDQAIEQAIEKALLNKSFGYLTDKSRSVMCYTWRGSKLDYVKKWSFTLFLLIKWSMHV